MREIPMCERNLDQLVASPRSQLACALPGNQTCILLVCGTMPNLLNHSSQGEIFYIFKRNSHFFTATYLEFSEGTHLKFILHGIFITQIINEDITLTPGES